MTTLKDIKIEKLPKWVQLEFKKLQGQVDALSKQLDQIENVSGKMKWREVLSSRTHGIPEIAVVEADIDGGDVSVLVQDGYLSVSSNRGALIVQPQSANVVRIRCGEFWQKEGDTA